MAEAPAVIDAHVERLRAAGLRVGDRRRALLVALASSDGPVAAEDLAEASGLSVSQAYRSLASLEAVGVVGHTHSHGRRTTWALVDRPPEVELVCVRCGTTQQVPASMFRHVSKRVTEDTGFAADFTHHTISGLCRECRTVAADALPFAHAHS